MTNEDTAKISEEVCSLKAEIEKIANTVREYISVHGRDAAARIQDTAEDAWTGAKEKFGAVKQKIHEDPVTATAAAFGIGLVVGLLLSRRRR